MNQVEKTGTTPETEVIKTEPSQQTPIDIELEKEKNKTEGRSEAEKAAFSLKKNAERAKELGIDPAEILGLKKKEVESSFSEDTVVTVGMLEKMRREQSQKSAIELAEAITDVKERELTIQYLKTRIVPTGDAEDDLRFARQAVNSIKNGQIAEEIARGTTPKNFSSGAGAPPAKTLTTPELTPSEQQFTRPPFNMTPEEIISKRQ